MLEVVPHVFTKNLKLIILLGFEFLLEKLKRRTQKGKEQEYKRRRKKERREMM